MTQFSTLIVFLVSIGFSVSCATRAFNNASSPLQLAQRDTQVWRPGGKVLSGPGTTYAYHWTNDARALSSPEAYLQSIVLNVHSQNASWILNANTIMGHGIYVAADPFSSRSYGRNLLVIPIRPEVRFDVATERTTSDTMLVRSDSKGILYSFKGYAKNRDGKRIHYAAVIRDTTIIDLSAVKAFGPVPECKSITSTFSSRTHAPLEHRLRFILNDTCFNKTGSFSEQRGGIFPEREIFSSLEGKIQERVHANAPQLRLDDLKGCANYYGDTGKCISNLIQYLPMFFDGTFRGEAKHYFEAARRAGLYPQNSEPGSGAEFARTVVDNLKANYADLFKTQLEILALQESVLVETDKSSLANWSEK